ncbi:MAG: branched-chain amino acid transaminase [Bryobacteraceae bacterium]|nr:branched-chain amino acid transaminase [Bryobacteraceae bacterium]
MTPTEKIWHNGEFINWEDARIHVLSHVVSYGSSVFEGIRCYETASGPAIFRLREHLRRMLDSAKIYRMEESRFTLPALAEAAVELVRVNRLRSCYIRPIMLRGYGQIGVDGSRAPIEIYLACWEWGKYLGEEALAKGVDICVSSWSRLAPNTLPALAKGAGNYANSQLIRMEANIDGYEEGIALDPFGYVSEGSGENVFVARDGVIYTPPLSNSVLPGITRDSVLTLCGDLGIAVQQAPIPREALYIADEIFFTGTAAEITPVRSVDRITVGQGRRGPLTQKLQEAFFAIVNGRVEDRFGWLTPVPAQEPVRA